MARTLTDPKLIHTILKRGVSEIIVEAEFERMLKEGRPLRLKMGFDPSRPDIHLGHAVGLRKLRQLQDLGHQVILIVGDWTAQIGDPSGQSATRQMLTADEVRSNAETYMTQFFKVVDKERTQTLWQSEWFSKFSLSDVFDLTRRFTVAQFLARDDFAQRFHTQRPIAITELLYPLLQAYDSLVIESDVEFGGSDQRFNLLVGRDLQGMMGQNQQQCFIMPILVGTDGILKMSKSLDNYIGIDESPDDMYGKVMSITDPLIMSYLELLTDIPDPDLVEMHRAMKSKSVNPMSLKKRLAEEIVTQFHDRQSAQRAREHFESIHQRGETPESIPQFVLSFSSPQKGPNADVLTSSNAQPDRLYGSSDINPHQLYINLPRLLVAASLASSRSEAKRLISQGAVQIQHKLQQNEQAVIAPEDIVQVGRRRFVKIVNFDTGK